MPPTKKSLVIEAIFNQRWDNKTKTLKGSTVTLEEVESAIIDHNRLHPELTLSSRNPANFFKDFIRNKRSANRNWPSSVLARGYTARQITGSNLCFEFVQMPPGQVEPFQISIISPSKSTPRHVIQSASMSLASRRLGRQDEAWLIQVLVKLNVIETHLAITSSGKILQVDLLQTNLKQARTEIDALFLALESTGKEEDPLNEILVTCEAKGRSDDILEDQILAQVIAAFQLRASTQEHVIPIAVKIVGPSEVHVVQFSTVSRSEYSTLSEISISNEAVYKIVPLVPGIGD
jgi:hypothetical protein